LERVRHRLFRRRHARPDHEPALARQRQKAGFGWSSDDKIEAMRAEWVKPGDLEDRQDIAAQMQQRAFV
jgi:hypothetical protein